MKTKLKERLLEIPINSSAFREKFRLSKDLCIDIKYIELLLNELCELKILKEKIKYKCRTCGDTIVLDKQELEELIVEDHSFQCENCTELVSIENDKTRYVFYDILDRTALINW